MIHVDWALLGLIAISFLIGLWRGFIKEVFALAVWVAAFLVAFLYSGVLADLIGDRIELPSARSALAFAGLFLFVLLVGGLLTWLIGKLVEKTGLTGTDRLLGSLFGLLRGVLLVVALIIVAGFTPIPEDPWWDESRVIRSMLPLADWGATFLPDEVLEYFELFPVVEQVKELQVLNSGAVLESPAA